MHLAWLLVLFVPVYKQLDLFTYSKRLLIMFPIINQRILCFCLVVYREGSFVHSHMQGEISVALAFATTLTNFFGHCNCLFRQLIDYIHYTGA